MGKNLGDPHHRVPLQPNKAFNPCPVLLISITQTNHIMKCELPDIIQYNTIYNLYMNCLYLYILQLYQKFYLR